MGEWARLPGRDSRGDAGSNRFGGLIFFSSFRVRTVVLMTFGLIFYILLIMLYNIKYITNYF